MKKYHIGIIGYGGFGKFLHHSWRKKDNLEIAAVADLNPENKPAKNIRFYKQWQDLLKDDDIDIVSIATPPSTHADMACAAMKSHKNVLLEKPLAITIKDANRIIKTRKQTGKIATVDYMLRFNPLLEKLQSLTRKKTFGELRRVSVENYAQSSSLPPDHWFWNTNMSGGILIEHAVHFIDLVHFFTPARPEKVNGLSCPSKKNHENPVLADILYDNGLMATHYHAFSRPGFFEETTIRMIYDLAQIELKGWIPLSGIVTALTNSKTIKDLQQLYNFRITNSNAIENIKDDSRPEGWGEQPGEMKKRIISSGIEYQVDKMISGIFHLSMTKAEAYSECLRAILNDIVLAIENPGHALRVSLNDGLSSLKIAVKATESAQHKRGMANL